MMRKNTPEPSPVRLRNVLYAATQKMTLLQWIAKVFSAYGGKQCSPLQPVSRKIRHRWLIICCCCLPLMAQADVAKKVTLDAIVVFGDSLSDNGNFYRLSNDRLPAAPYYDGRFSNGPVWVEDLSQQLRLPLADYAISGAQTSGGVYQSLLAQLSKYQRLNERADPNALYIIWGGSNNYLLNQKADLTDVKEAVGDIKYIIEQLASGGARYFLVPNLPNLSQLPLVRQIDAKAGNEAFAQHLNDLVDTHNTQLKAVLTKEAKRLNVQIVQFDAYDWFNQLIEDPGKLNVIQPCYSGKLKGGAPDSTCAQPEKYLFWDKVHPTATIQKKLAQQALVELAQAGLIPKNAVSADA